MSEMPASDTDEPIEVLRALWSADDQQAGLDEIHGPQQACKNMREVTFDGLAEPGSDLGAAWRDRLAREGKLGPAGQSLRDLVLGTTDR